MRSDSFRTPAPAPTRPGRRPPNQQKHSLQQKEAQDHRKDMVCVCASARLLNDQFKSCVHHSPAAHPRRVTVPPRPWSLRRENGSSWGTLGSIGSGNWAPLPPCRPSLGGGCPPQEAARGLCPPHAPRGDVDYRLALHATSDHSARPQAPGLAGTRSLTAALTGLAAPGRAQAMSRDS